MVINGNRPTPALSRQRHMFGMTPSTQAAVLAHHKRAYYGLIYPDTIVEKLNMSPLFHTVTATYDYINLGEFGRR